MRRRASLFLATLGLGALSVGAEPRDVPAQVAPVPAAGEVRTQITLDQARQIAQTALNNGNPALTRQLAQGLLQANARDAHAFLLLSASEIGLQNPKAARKAAARAFRLSQAKPQKLQAAQMAAGQAMAEDRPTLSQIWLRRAATQASTPEESKSLARAYARVRAANPFSVDLAFSVRPSDNVNNGADSAIQLIDGVPVVGYLSRDAQAISGTILGADARLSYRLRANERSATTLSGRVYVQRVLLSDDAVTVTNSDFDATYGEVSLNHVFALDPEGKQALRLAATGGNYWSDDDTNYRLARFDADYIWRPADNLRLSLGVSYTKYDRPDTVVNDSNSFILRGSLSNTRPNGDRLSANLNFQDADSDARNRRSDQLTARLSYAFAKNWGPAQATASLTAGYAEYPDYIIGGGFFFILPPGGRRDRSISADLSLFFEDYDYAGFAPSVTFSAGRTSSNVSRFDTREFSVGFGVQSKF